MCGKHVVPPNAQVCVYPKIYEKKSEKDTINRVPGQPYDWTTDSFATKKYNDALVRELLGI